MTLATHRMTWFAVASIFGGDGYAKSPRSVKIDYEPRQSGDMGAKIMARARNYRQNGA